MKWLAVSYSGGPEVLYVREPVWAWTDDRESAYRFDCEGDARIAAELASSNCVVEPYQTVFEELAEVADG